eukprot:43824_1
MAEEDGRQAHVRLSMQDPDEMEIELSVQRALNKSVLLSENIFNAYLVKKYKWSERSRWKKASCFMRFYVSILPYFIAIIQWAAVIVMCLIQFSSYKVTTDNLQTFNLFPDEYWMQKVVCWPFFFIACAYTYSKTLVCEVDIWSLKHDGVVVCDLSQNKCKCNMEIFFLKHLTEASLQQWGGLFFYSILAGCSNYKHLGDFTEILWSILGYIFIFELDEYAYLLVKDIFIFTFNDKTSSDDPNTPFYGKNIYSIDGAKQAPLRLLAVFLVSVAILGIFMRSYLILWIFGGLWVIVEISKLFIGGHQISLYVKQKPQ